MIFIICVDFEVRRSLVYQVAMNEIADENFLYVSLVKVLIISLSVLVAINCLLRLVQGVHREML